MTTTLPDHPGHWLAERAARSFTAVSRAVPFAVTVTSAGRDPARQEALFRARYERRAAPYAGPFGDVRWWRGERWVRMRGAAVAVPGTSNHERGIAVDIGEAGRSWTTWTDRNRVAWLTRARAHGWLDDEGRAVGEPWHMRYSATHDTQPGMEDDDMNSAQDAALAALYGLFFDGGRGEQAIGRTLGFLDQRYDGDGNPARALDTLDGQVLRDDIAAAAQAAVAETSAAYHQLVELLGGGRSLEPVPAAEALVRVMGPVGARELADALAVAVEQ